MLPEAQLYHYKGRVYDPGLGRFLQTDPVGSKDDLNLYSYVGNDPLDRTDPAGTEAATAEWLQQTQALNASSPWGSPEEIESFVLDTLPIVGEYRAVSSFLDQPSWLGAGIIAASAVDLGGVAREAKAEGVIYERINKANPAEKPYIGRAKSEKRFVERQQEHARANPDADHDYKVVDRAEPGQPLREAEQQQITARGGPTNGSNPNGGTSNRRNEIKQKKRQCVAPIGTRIPRC